MDRKTISINDLEKAMEIMRKQNIPRIEVRPIYLTKQMVQTFIQGGEKVDLIAMTINGHPFDYFDEILPIPRR